MKNSKVKSDKIANAEKAALLYSEKKKSINFKTIGIVILLVVVAVIVTVIVTTTVVRAMGKKALEQQASSVAPAIAQAEYTETVTEEEQEQADWQEGWIKYDGKVYEYNDSIRTFLIMGIDKNSDAIEVAEGTNGGQADALFLVILNPHDESIKVLAINRNTMTDINIYDEYGAYVNTVNAQIAVQHGFGNGVEESCEYQLEAVDHLLYSIPIHGYCAINMSAISTLNDAVGGVTLTALEDVKTKNTNITANDEITLMGEDAFYYVKYRDTNVFGSADNRLARQKQYLNAYIGKVKKEAKSNIGIVSDLYNAIKDQMITNISLSEVTYMASTYLGYSFDSDHIYTLKGETVMGEEFEEFYADDQGVYELILELFYEQVKGK